MNIAYSARIAAGLCIGCLGIITFCPADDVRTLQEIRKGVVAGSQSGQAQTNPAGDSLALGRIRPVDSTPTRCPAPLALDMLKHEIAYQRTEESDPLRNIPELHADVWQRGPLTAFYVRGKLGGFAPNLRMTYLFGKDGLRGGGTCPAEKNWRECVEGFARLEYATDVVGTCTITLNMNTIPAWRPSPNDSAKRRITDELLSEIESKWPGVQEIVLRDFNLKDNQITMYLRTPDGDYYQGCGFDAMSEPHCEGWHLFGNTPNSSIRKWIFERPYRLK
jgi:hypothetical protein